jgi:hypothetical protein
MCSLNAAGGTYSSVQLSRVYAHGSVYCGVPPTGQFEAKLVGSEP